MAIAAVFEFPGEPVEKYHKVFEAGDAIVDQSRRLPRRTDHDPRRHPVRLTITRRSRTGQGRPRRRGSG